MTPFLTWWKDAPAQQRMQGTFQRPPQCSPGSHISSKGNGAWTASERHLNQVVREPAEETPRTQRPSSQQHRAVPGKGIRLYPTPNSLRGNHQRADFQKLSSPTKKNQGLGQRVVMAGGGLCSDLRDLLVGGPPISWIRGKDISDPPTSWGPQDSPVTWGCVPLQGRHQPTPLWRIIGNRSLSGAAAGSARRETRVVHIIHTHEGPASIRAGNLMACKLFWSRVTFC